MTGRVVLLVTSPRLPAGLLTAAAWDLVRAHGVFAGAQTGQSDALNASGVIVTITENGVDDLLAATASDGTAVWLSGATGDEQLARQLGLRLAREPQLAELELMYASWDPPGARLLDAVTVMDRLASPGGDPWKRQQTHASLAKYMLEEAYEAVDAIDAADYDALREELGDLLLQVVLHARLAEELPEGEAWSIDDVAGGLVAKMVRRNPHVFGDSTVETIDEITEQWERIKRAEKAGTSAMDSIALSQPALSLAAKIQSRSKDFSTGTPDRTASVPSDGLGADIGARLWDIVTEAAAAGLDAEAELRRVALLRMSEFRESEGGE
jgi:XTP/dITP diphosphohydrolase